MAVNINPNYGYIDNSFLSRLCGGESRLRNTRLRFNFLSRLCGGECPTTFNSAIASFLSRLCGGE